MSSVVCLIKLICFTPNIILSSSALTSADNSQEITNDLIDFAFTHQEIFLITRREIKQKVREAKEK